MPPCSTLFVIIYRKPVLIVLIWLDDFLPKRIYALQTETLSLITLLYSNDNELIDTMKKLKLWLHSKEFEDEVVFNPKDFPHVRVGDFIEIYHPEDDKDTVPGQPRLLLQVRTSSVHGTILHLILFL